MENLSDKREELCLNVAQQQQQQKQKHVPKEYQESSNGNLKT